MSTQVRITPDGEVFISFVDETNAVFDTPAEDADVWTDDFDEDDLDEED